MKWDFLQQARYSSKTQAIHLTRKGLRANWRVKKTGVRALEGWIRGAGKKGLEEERVKKNSKEKRGMKGDKEGTEEEEGLSLINFRTRTCSQRRHHRQCHRLSHSPKLASSRSKEIK